MKITIKVEQQIPYTTDRCVEEMQSVFAVHSGEWNGKRKWHTGEFDRSHPPYGYVNEWSCAALWTKRDGAESYAAEFGGTVVEFRLTEISQNVQAQAQPPAATLERNQEK